MEYLHLLPGHLSAFEANGTNFSEKTLVVVKFGNRSVLVYSVILQSNHNLGIT
jgi:hypothetical protein